MFSFYSNCEKWPDNKQCKFVSGDPTGVPVGCGGDGHQLGLHHGGDGDVRTEEHARAHVSSQLP